MKTPPRIVINPEVMGGQPCFAGTRVPVDTILACLRAGNEMSRIVESYPFMTRKHVGAARAWEREQQRAPRPIRTEASVRYGMELRARYAETAAERSAASHLALREADQMISEAREGLRKVLGHLPAESRHFFLSSKSTWLGETPLEALRKGRMSDVLAAAAGFVER